MVSGHGQLDDFDGDWDDFHFPTVPVRIFATPLISPRRHVQDGDEDQAGEGEGEGGSGLPSWQMSPDLHVMVSDLDLPGADLAMGWRYVPELRSICHVALNKTISLDSLDSVPKIMRHVRAMQSAARKVGHPEYVRQICAELDDFVDSLNMASLDCYGETVSWLLSNHADGRPMKWPEPPLPPVEEIPASLRYGNAF